MPLVRYEVRCEHSLANPELYRTAGQDDSEGLLEGVAMAGLVGIVRQLGDLAEFAAEIFDDLHDDMMTVVSRGRNLKARLARLEVDLPAVEKALLAESSQFKFAYSARSKWRAPLPMDQNLCAQDELPRFVRNFYDDCRGPPRLFLLDKFDEAGRGACVKRYTDPSVFRLSWAASQLTKAEQLGRAREAEFLKNAAAERGNADAKMYARARLSSALFENLEGFTGDFTPELRSRRLDRAFEVPTEGVLTPDGIRSPERTRHPHPLPQVAEGPVLAPLKITAKDIANVMRGRRLRIGLSHDDEEAVSEAESSDAEFYVDAMTTMESDPDSEPGSRTRWEVDSLQSRESEPATESLKHSVLKAHVEAHLFTPPEESDEVDRDGDISRGREELGSPVAGFDTVRESEDAGGHRFSVKEGESGSVDETVGYASVASVVEDPRNGLAIVVEHAPHQNVLEEESLIPSKLPDKPPDKLPDTFSEKLSDTLSDQLPHTLSDQLPDTLSEELPHTLSDQLPGTLSDNLPPTLSDKLPDTLSEELPDTLSVTLPDTLPNTLSAKLPDTLSEELPHSLSDQLPPPLSDNLPRTLPDKRPHTLSDKLPDIHSDKLPSTLSAKLPDTLPDKRPHILSEKLPDTLPDTLPNTPDTLPDTPPDTLPYTLPDTLSDKLPDNLSEERPHTLSEELPHSLSDQLPHSLSDQLPPLSDNLPCTLPDKRPHILSEKLPDTLPNTPPDTPDTLPYTLPDTLFDKLPYKRPDDKLSSVPPKNPPADGLSEKLSDTLSDKGSDKVPRKSPAKVLEPLKPTYQSHESVSLQERFRPSVRVRPIVASIEARAQQSLAVTSSKSQKPLAGKKPDDHPVVVALKQPSSPVTTPRSRRLWANDNNNNNNNNNNAPQAKKNSSQRRGWTNNGTNGAAELSAILRSRMLETEGDSTASSLAIFGDDQERISGHLKLYHNSSSNGSSHMSLSSSAAEEERDRYSSSDDDASSTSPKGLPNFCALLSPSESPPRVAEGLMAPPKSLFLTDSHFDRLESARSPPVAPFLSDSPSVSRSPSVIIKPRTVGNGGGGVNRSGLLPPVASDSDQVKTVVATSPSSRASENRGPLQLVQPSRNQEQCSPLPNPVLRPRTWVDRSASNVAATLRAIRQAATVAASDDDTGSECRSDCELVTEPKSRVDNLKHG